MCDNIDIRMGKVEDAEAVAQHNVEMAGFDSVRKLRHGSMVVQEKRQLTSHSHTRRPWRQSRWYARGR